MSDSSAGSGEPGAHDGGNGMRPLRRDAERNRQRILKALPAGARFDRCVEFRDPGGKLIVSATTTWALIDRASGRPVRVPADVAAPFWPAP